MQGINKKKENDVIIYSLTLFQTHITFIPQWNTKGDILKNVLDALFHEITKHSEAFKLLKRILKHHESGSLFAIFQAAKSLSIYLL